MKKLTILLISFLLAFAHIFANDSVLIQGTETISIDYSENLISIQNEVLNIYLYADKYKVRVEYKYENSGDEKNLLLGFPIKYHSTAGTKEKNEKLNTISFTQLFNGKEIAIKEMQDEEKSNTGYNVSGTYWIKREVKFKKGKNESIIEYTMPYSRGGYSRFFNYIIKTASCWNNNIKELDIYIHNDNEVLITGWKIGNYNQNNCPKEFNTKADNIFHFHFKDVNPKELDSIQLELASYNLGHSGIPFNSQADGWCWNFYKIYENPNEIRLYTKPQIQLFINCFYASRGYIFKSETLNRYFSEKNFDFIGLYTPDKDFNENKFNDTEYDNLNYLLGLKKNLYK